MQKELSEGLLEITIRLSGNWDVFLSYTARSIEKSTLDMKCNNLTIAFLASSRGLPALRQKVAKRCIRLVLFGKGLTLK